MGIITLAIVVPTIVASVLLTMGLMTSTSRTEPRAPRDGGGGVWECANCGTENGSGYNFCRECVSARSEA